MSKSKKYTISYYTITTFARKQSFCNYLVQRLNACNSMLSILSILHKWFYRIGKASFSPSNWPEMAIHSGEIPSYGSVPCKYHIKHFDESNTIDKNIARNMKLILVTNEDIDSCHNLQTKILILVTNKDAYLYKIEIHNMFLKSFLLF